MQPSCKLYDLRLQLPTSHKQPFGIHTLGQMGCICYEGMSERIMGTYRKVSFVWGFW